MRITIKHNLPIIIVAQSHFLLALYVKQNKAKQNKQFDDFAILTVVCSRKFINIIVENGIKIDIWNLVQWHNFLYSCGIFCVLIYSCLLHI